MNQKVGYRTSLQRRFQRAHSDTHCPSIWGDIGKRFFVGVVTGFGTWYVNRGNAVFDPWSVVIPLIMGVIAAIVYPVIPASLAFVGNFITAHVHDLLDEERRKVEKLEPALVNEQAIASQLRLDLARETQSSTDLTNQLSDAQTDIARLKNHVVSFDSDIRSHISMSFKGEIYTIRVRKLWDNNDRNRLSLNPKLDFHVRVDNVMPNILKINGVRGKVVIDGTQFDHSENFDDLTMRAWSGSDYIDFTLAVNMPFVQEMLAKFGKSESVIIDLTGLLVDISIVDANGNVNNAPGQKICDNRFVVNGTGIEPDTMIVPSFYRQLENKALQTATLAQTP